MFAYVTEPYQLYKELIKLIGVVFKLKLIKIESAEVKPKTSSQQYKIFGNFYNAIIQKNQTYYQQHQSQHQQPAAQYLAILQSPNQQNCFLKSQYVMHQR